MKITVAFYGKKQRLGGNLHSPRGPQRAAIAQCIPVTWRGIA
jgi:hypothetical protein